jgi:hypothetical protein
MEVPCAESEGVSFLQSHNTKPKFSSKKHTHAQRHPQSARRLAAAAAASAHAASAAHDVSAVPLTTAHRILCRGQEMAICFKVAESQQGYLPTWS